jgi:predicted nucleic acid-binding protein
MEFSPPVCEIKQVVPYYADQAYLFVYLIAKDESPEQARVTLTSILQFLKIAPVDQNTIEQALNLDYKDFEDADHMIAAIQVHAHYLVTRNKRDFQPAPLEVVQPVALLAVLKQ